MTQKLRDTESHRLVMSASIQEDPPQTIRQAILGNIDARTVADAIAADQAARLALGAQVLGYTVYQTDNATLYVLANGTNTATAANWRSCSILDHPRYKELETILAGRLGRSSSIKVAGSSLVPLKVASCVTEVSGDPNSGYVAQAAEYTAGESAEVDGADPNHIILMGSGGSAVVTLNLLFEGR